MHPEQARIDAAMAAIEATREDVAQIARTSKSVAEAEARLEELKTRAKRNAKRLALELHPDRTGNDPEKMRQLQDIHLVLNDLLRCKVQPPPPPPVQVRVVQFIPMQWSPWAGGTVTNSGTWTATDTTTTSGTTGVWFRTG